MSERKPTEEEMRAAFEDRGRAVDALAESARRELGLPDPEDDAAVARWQATTQARSERHRSLVAALLMEHGVNHIEDLPPEAQAELEASRRLLRPTPPEEGSTDTA